MSYENFITKLLNIKPSEVLSVAASSKKDDTIILIKNSSCPICSIASKTHGYYKRELIHSTLVNRKCIIVYAGSNALNAVLLSASLILSLTAVKELLTKPKLTC